MTKYKCTATTTDGTEFTRKRCTRAYAYACIGEKNGKAFLVGMSMSHEGAMRCVGHRACDNFTILPVIATEIKTRPRNEEPTGTTRLSSDWGADDYRPPQNEGSLQNGNYECAGRGDE